MFFEIAFEDLQQGVLAAAFAQGAVAAIIRSRVQVGRLWSRLMEDGDEHLPWEARLIDIARNHHGGGDITKSLGDVFYFQPGQHGYIARKFEISSNEDGVLRIDPPAFVDHGAPYVPRPEAVSTCWELVQRISRSLSVDDPPPKVIKATVQRLKYQARADDFTRLAGMTEHALGRWGRLGFRLDANRRHLCRLLSHKGIADLFSIMLIIPLLRVLARSINRLLSRLDRRVPDRAEQPVIEAAHVDNRYFSALCGSRVNVRTEVRVGGQWHELPIDRWSLAVFPGTLATRRQGLPATRHRVLYEEGDPARLADPRTDNVTLLLGAVW